MRANRRLRKTVLDMDLAKLVTLMAVALLLPWLLAGVALITTVRSLAIGDSGSPLAQSTDGIVVASFIVALSGYGLTVAVALALTIRLRQRRLVHWVDQITMDEKDPIDVEDFQELNSLNPSIYGMILQIHTASARLRALNDINQRINSSMDIEVMLPEITRSAVELLCATSGSVVLRDENGVWQNVAGYNFPAEIVYKNVPKSLGLAAEVVERGEPVVVDDYATYERRVPLLDPCGFGATVGVPLVTDGQRIGALCVGTSDPLRRFGNTDVELLSSFANQAAVAIKNARLYSDNLRRLEELRQAKKELDRTASQLRSLLSKTFQNQEEIRRRIAADIHDGLTQLVVGALYHIQSVKPLISQRTGDSEGLIEGRLEAAHGLLRQTIDEMYRVIYNLRPASIEETGLVRCVERYIKRFQESSGTDCHFEVIGAQRRFRVQREIAIYRVLQEALNNVRKHSNASIADVCLHYYSDSIAVVIRDDGIGFDKTKAIDFEEQHLGIIDMVERAYSVGGHLEVVSAPGQGTTVRMQIPTTP